MFRQKVTTAKTPNYSFKVVFLGDHQTGKSSVASILSAKGKASLSYMRTVSDEQSYPVVNIHDDRVKFELIDIGVSNNPTNLENLARERLCKDAQLVCLFFDVTKKESLDNLDQWKKMAERLAKNALFVLIGTHVDLDSPNKKDLLARGQRFSESTGMQYQKINAMSAVDVQGIFARLAEQLIQKYPKATPVKEMSKKYLMNVAVCGEKGVGKTALCSQLTMKFKQAQDNNVVFNLFDSKDDYNQQYATCTRANIILLVVDVNNSNGYEYARSFLEKIKQYEKTTYKVFIIANKIDLEIKIDLEKLGALSPNLLMVSAKDNLNIEGVYSLLMDGNKPTEADELMTALDKVNLAPAMPKKAEEAPDIAAPYSYEFPDEYYKIWNGVNGDVLEKAAALLKDYVVKAIHFNRHHTVQVSQKLELIEKGEMDLHLLLEGLRALNPSKGGSLSNRIKFIENYRNTPYIDVPVSDYTYTVG